ncbi:MAG TPA: two-component regulator propeller domain-containing protein, partial [Cyclobacteriaceae bacterium]|nr:two-component regulator propeller domain-containing protein [Cyclobacteriaceae bacterium]
KISRVYSIADSIYFIDRLGKIGTVYNDTVYSWSKAYFPKHRVVRMHSHKQDVVVLYMRPSKIVFQSTNGFTDIKLPDKNLRVEYFCSYKNELIVTTNLGYYIIRNNELIPFNINLKGILMHYDESKDLFWTFDNYNRILYKSFYAEDELLTEIVERDITVQHIVNDSEGNTWIGTLDQGFKKYYAPHFMKLSVQHSYRVTAVIEDNQQRLWVGTAGEGIKILDSHGNLQNQLRFDNLFQNNINVLRLSPEGKLWAGTQRGVAVIDIQKEKVEQWLFDDGGAIRHIIKNIDFDVRNRIWISTADHGVICMDADSIKRYTSHEKLSGKEVNAVVYDDKNDVTYVATSFGVDRICKDKVSPLNLPGNLGKGVTSIYKGEADFLLLGTPGWGLLAYHLYTGKWKKIDGLTSDFIYFVTEDEYGAYWVGTDKGINRIEIDQDFKLQHVKQYAAASGFKSIETYFHAFHFSKMNKWIGMADGLYKLNKEDFNEQADFPLHFTNLELFYGSIPIDNYASDKSGFFDLPLNPSFPADKNHLTFSFNCVNKSDPQYIRFSYKLEGHEDLWSLPSQTNRVTYSALPPGNYVFKVIAYNNWGNTGGKEISYPFTILQPFYQSAYFQFSIAILFIVLTFLLFYWRVRARISKALELEAIRQQESNKIRKEVARDFHDEVGNMLAKIINHVGLLRMKFNGSFEKNDLLIKVEESAKHLHRGTKDFIWSIDPESDDLLNAFLYLRDLGTKIFNEDLINYKAFNELNYSCRLPYGYGREIIMIFKEAMTNTFKYAEADEVTLSLSIRQDVFIITLSDNGNGFDLSNALISSRGIRNMYARAKKINAQLTITSNVGTTVSLLINQLHLRNERKEKNINY